MEYKTEIIEVLNREEALEYIKRKYGEDTIIRDIRELPPDDSLSHSRIFSRLFKKKQPKRLEIKIGIASKKKRDPKKEGKTMKEEKDQIKDIEEQVLRAISTMNTNANKRKFSIEIDEKTKIFTLEKEIKEIKELLNSFLSQNKEIKIETTNIDIEKEFVELKRLLISSNLPEDVAVEYINRLKGHIPIPERSIPGKVIERAKKVIDSWVVPGGDLLKGARRKIVMFMGPTGVGKTTTIAKLAAIYFHPSHKIPVSIISTDNYRIGTIDQLKKYADIMKAPFYKATGVDELKKRLDGDKAVLTLIDTTGINPKNKEKLFKLKSDLENIDYKIEPILIVAANTPYYDLMMTFESFNIIDYKRVIITKVDEATSILPVLTVVEKYGKEVSYITTGQDVPTDILLVEKGKLSDYIFQGE